MDVIFYVKVYSHRQTMIVIVNAIENANYSIRRCSYYINIVFMHFYAMCILGLHPVNGSYAHD